MIGQGPFRSRTESTQHLKGSRFFARLQRSPRCPGFDKQQSRSRAEILPSDELRVSWPSQLAQHFQHQQQRYGQNNPFDQRALTAQTTTTASHGVSATKNPPYSQPAPNVMRKRRAHVSSHHNELSALVCLTRFVLVFVQHGVSTKFTRASPAELNYFKAGPVHGKFAHYVWLAARLFVAR